MTKTIKLIHMTQRTKTLIIIFGSAILVMVIILIVFLLMRSNEQAPPSNTTGTNTNVNVVVINTNTASNQNTNTAPNDELTITRLANLFVERFGSFSTEAKYQNLIDLKPYMTTTMQTWVDTTVAGQSQAAPTGYTSVTARVLSTTVVSQTAAAAELTISTRRTEEGDTTNSAKTYYQDITVKMVKSGDDWKVDSALWQ